MESELNVMKAEVTSLKDRLAGIPSKVGELEHAMQSLERFVGVPSLSARREQHDAIANAPLPLVRIFDSLEKVHDDPKYMSQFNLSVKDDPALSVVIEIPSQNETIEFTFSTEWNIVLAESLMAQDLLINLLDESDSGETLPSPPSGKTEAPNFKSTLKRPYRWAQALAGLDQAGVVNASNVIDKLLERGNVRSRAKV